MYEAYLNDVGILLVWFICTGGLKKASRTPCQPELVIDYFAFALLVFFKATDGTISVKKFYTSKVTTESG